MLTQKGITIPRCLKPEQEKEVTLLLLVLKVTPIMTTQETSSRWPGRSVTQMLERQALFSMLCTLPFKDVCSLYIFWAVRRFVIDTLKVIYHKLMARTRLLKFGLFSLHPIPLPLLQKKKKNGSYYQSKIEHTSNLLPASSMKVEKKQLGEVPLPENKGDSGSPLR